MVTGSISSASITLRKHQERQALPLTFTNASGGELKEGQQVYCNGNMTVDKIENSTDDAQTPIGFVHVGGANSERVTVMTYFNCSMKAINKTAGTISAGTLVRQNGTINADNVPEVIAVSGDTIGGTEAVGQWATAIVISGGVADAQIETAVFRVPIRPLPATS